MTYRLKLFLIIMPLIIISIGFVATVFIAKMTAEIESLHLELMTMKVAKLRADCENAVSMLNRSGFSDQAYYIRGYQFDVIGTAETLTIPAGKVFILNRDGKVLTQNPPPAALIEALAKTPATRTAGTLIHGDGSERRLAVFQVFPEWGWRICATAKHDVILKSVRDARNITILSACVAIGITALLLFFFISSISKPIQKLRMAFRSIGEENFDTRLDIRSRDEIGELARGFNAMSDKMKTLVGNLKTEINERKQAEEALRKSEERFRELADHIHEVFWLFDIAREKVIYVSPAYETVWRRSRESLYARYQDWADSIHPDDLDYAQSSFLEVQKDGEGKPREYRIIRPDGEVRWISDKGFAVRDAAGAIIRIAGIAEDITEQKKAAKKKSDLEAIVARSKKMEAIGLLAGGVAHDLNNILSGIVSLPELILMDPKLSPKQAKAVQTIKASGQRAVAVVNDLLTMTRGAASAKEPIILNRLVRTYLFSPEHKALEAAFPTTTIETDLDEELLNINGSAIHINKTLMNLVNNAFEAINVSASSKNQILIQTRNQYVDFPIRGYDSIHPGEYVMLTVADSGDGISESDIDRIFEPFYTKKVMGRSGTGLGLTVVWNTVQDHNGYIDVETTANGTRFTLYFPATRKAAPEKIETSDIQQLAGKGEAILVVDDEETQRLIACEFLRKLGYTPNAVSDGEAAVAYLQQHPVDLLVLDMIMPAGINGRETYERILEIKPGQKAIIASGFSESEDVKAAQRLGAGPYLKKPYTLEKLGRAVQAELRRG